MCHNPQIDAIVSIGNPISYFYVFKKHNIFKLHANWTVAEEVQPVQVRWKDVKTPLDAAFNIGNDYLILIKVRQFWWLNTAHFKFKCTM